MEEQLKVTSIEEAKQMLKGEILKLSPFTGCSQPFVVRVKKPSLIGLVRSGRIPNQLLVKSNDLFKAKGDITKVSQDEDYENLLKVMDVLIEETLVEPTYKDLKDNGIELNDKQMMEIFNYTQSEVKSITPSV